VSRRSRVTNQPITTIYYQLIIMDDNEIDNDNDQQQQQIKASTYNELTALIEDLRVRLRNAEQTAGQTRNDASVNVKNSTRCNEIRVFTKLDHSVRVFTGSESNYDAADWIQSVENVADLNACPRLCDKGTDKWELAQYALGRVHRNLDELLNDLLDWTRMFTVR